MIDFVKPLIREKATMKRLRPDEQYLSNVGLYDGEIKSEKYHFDNLIFTYRADYLTIGLKPHYQKNNHLHNADRFDPFECIDEIQKFINKYDLKPEICKVANLEFGLNFNQPYDIRDVLPRYKYHSKRKQKHNVGEYSYIFNSSQNKKRTYFYKAIKLYAKGLQPDDSGKANYLNGYCKKNCGRFEIKSTDRSYINKIGIYTLADLLKIETYIDLIGILTNEYEQFLVLDNMTPIKDFNFNKKDKKKFKKYLSPYTWEKKLKRSRNVFNNNKKLYEELLYRNPNNLKQLVKNEIQKELSYYKNMCSLRKVENTHKCALYPLYGDINRTHRICIITEEDISMQKPESYLLSNTGLKHLEEVNPIRFEFLKSVLLTGEPNKYERTIYDQMSKQIRNRYYNNYSRYQTMNLF